MTVVIVTILILCYLLVATESVTKVNRAAIAIFAGTVGWVLYICYGTDFVTRQYGDLFSAWQEVMHLHGNNSANVKYFIVNTVFLPYVGKAAEIVLFLLATMTIVEVLNNNGCFDFIRQLLRTRNSKKMLWMLGIITFVISANLDNLTTTVMMLTMMHGIIPSRRQRMIFGSAILIAANCGGALTVIGNPEGLILWNSGYVTATDFSMTLLVPCLLAWAIPTYALQEMLPERVETDWIVMPYRGDDTRLNVWQRLLMLFVGIGGLWFIPTFHNITQLSPFLGALCVLAVLWIVNEIFNRKLMNMDSMVGRRTPQVFQYGVIQMILFVLGFMLAVGVVNETGVFRKLLCFLGNDVLKNVWISGTAAGLISCALDNFVAAMTFITIPQNTNLDPAIMSSEVVENFRHGGVYWKVIAYMVMMGGNILCIGTISGLALMKMERMHMGWYFRNVGWKALVGGIAGMVALWVMITFFN